MWADQMPKSVMRGPLPCTRQTAAVSSADDQDSQNCPQIPKQTCLSWHHFMGIWGLSEIDQSNDQWLRNSSETLTFVEMLPRNLHKFHQTSLWIFPNRMPTMPLTQDEGSLATVTLTIRKTVFSLCWITGKFLFLVPVAGQKKGNFSRSCITWLWPALYGEANTRSQRSSLRDLLPLPLHESQFLLWVQILVLPLPSWRNLGKLLRKNSKTLYSHM